MGAAMHDRALEERFQGELHGERACFGVAGTNDLDRPSRVGFRWCASHDSSVFVRFFFLEALNLSAGTGLG